MLVARRGAVLMLAALAPTLLLAACDSRTNGVSVEEPWVRAAPQAESEGGGRSAAYMVLRNGSDEDDALVSASSEVANVVEIHQSAMDNGVMRMRPVEKIGVPARGEETLEPAGYHIMLMGLKQDLLEGSEIGLRLRFEQAGEVAVQVPVRKTAAMDMQK